MSINSKIVELYEKGKTTSEIAKELGVRYQRVYNTLITKGLQPRNSGKQKGEKRTKIEELLKEGKSTMEICWEVKTYPAYVNFIKKRMQLDK